MKWSVMKMIIVFWTRIWEEKLSMIHRNVTPSYYFLSKNITFFLGFLWTKAFAYLFVCGNPVQKLQLVSSHLISVLGSQHWNFRNVTPSRRGGGWGWWWLGEGGRLRGCYINLMDSKGLFLMFLPTKLAKIRRNIQYYIFWKRDGVTFWIFTNSIEMFRK